MLRASVFVFECFVFETAVSNNRSDTDYDPQDILLHYRKIGIQKIGIQKIKVI